MRLGLGAQIGQINIPILKTANRNDAEAGHDCAGGVGSVRGSGNEANVAMRLATSGVISANGEKSSIFALRTGVRLERNGGKTSDLSQPAFELIAHRAVASRLVVRRKGMQPGKLRPRDREHLGGRVQLHRAGAERDHRMAEREVARLEPPQVAQHLGLAVMGVEDRMGEKSRRSILDGRFPTGGRGARQDGAIFAKDGAQSFDVVRRARFVE